jgi:hypothetical protein
MGGLGLDEMRAQIARLEKIIASVASIGGTGLDALVGLVDSLRDRTTFSEGVVQRLFERIDVHDARLGALEQRVQGMISAVEHRMVAQADALDGQLKAVRIALGEVTQRIEAVEKLTPWEREGISHGQWLENKRKEKVAREADRAAK